jgi:hypothetical protein
LRWSPDGEHLAIQAEHEASVQDLLIVPADGWQPVLLELTSSVEWSPDSAFLLVASNGSLDVVRADGTGRRLVTRDPIDATKARWVP